MALQFTQTPQQYTPGYNEQVFASSGVTAGKNDYKFIFNVYDSTGTTKLVPTIKIPPRPTDSWAVFDAGRIIENYLASDIAIVQGTDDGVRQNSNSYYQYKVKLGEEYDLSTTGVTSYPDLVTSSGTIYAWNAAYPFQEFRDYNKVDIIGSDTPFIPSKYLTSARDLVAADGAKYINMDENEWLYGINAFASGFLSYIITTTDVSAAVEQFRVTNPYSAIVGFFMRAPVGTRNLNRVLAAEKSVISGAFPIIKSTTKSYTIQPVTTADVPSCESMSYRIRENYFTNYCSKYENIRVHWLNRWGGFDSYTFNKVSRTNEEIERKQYKKLYGATTGQWTYNNYDRGITNFNTSIKDTMVLNSDWVTEAESAFLEQLVASPEIYWDNDDELWAINITDTSYEKRKTVNDKIFNLTINVEVSQKRFTQRF